MSNLLSQRREVGELKKRYKWMALVVVAGSLMYLVEGGRNDNFASIPDSVYWAVTTMTTVGYGDIVPQTSLGRALATLIMIMGYGIIAVPTGIVTLELNEANRRQALTHLADAAFCYRCGENLFRGSSDERSPSD